MTLPIALALLSSFACDAGFDDASHDHVLVGAIRWDAWHGPASEVGLTVEKTLAPAHWHHRLPFYGKVVGEDVVEARGNTQEVMDQEISHAHTAGLDYWAFVIYPEENALSLGLKLYLSSERKSLVNFCLDLQGGWEAGGGPSAWSARIHRYVSYFKEPTYQDVLDGRPLVYLYSVEGLVGPGRFETWEDARTAFDELRAGALQVGAHDAGTQPKTAMPACHIRLSVASPASRPPPRPVISPYRADADGVLVPELPDTCPWAEPCQGPGKLSHSWFGQTEPPLVRQN